MHIILAFNTKGHLELRLETDLYKPNPEWAVNWVEKNMDWYIDSAQTSFNCIEGEVVIRGKKIVDFLLDLTQKAKYEHFSVIDTEQAMYGLSLAIQSVEQAKRLLTTIELLSEKNKLTEKDFDLLQEQPNKQDSKRQFLSEYRYLRKNKQNLFGTDYKDRINEKSSLEDIVKQAKIPNSPASEVFKRLKWTNHKGYLTKDAPEDVKEAFHATKPASNSSPPR